MSDCSVVLCSSGRVFVKQKSAYEMRMSDWSSDVCSSELPPDSEAAADQVLAAGGRAVAPGFINVLSWATESLIADGSGMGDTKQGVTLEIFDEGWSMGPLNEAMKVDTLKQQGQIRYQHESTTLGKYIEFLAACGATTTATSFETGRAHDRTPSTHANLICQHTPRH